MARATRCIYKFLSTCGGSQPPLLLLLFNDAVLVPSCSVLYNRESIIQTAKIGQTADIQIFLSKDSLLPGAGTQLPFDI